MSDARGEGYSQNYRRRKYAARYLSGDGIEIGGLHNPLDISGLPVARIRRVDRYDIATLREHYPPLHAMELVSVDIIDDGQILATIQDASLDFIVANHLIEHCDNPIGTLGNWLAKLKTGGVIFMTVPDKRVGFEEQRPLTPLDHIIEDYRCDGEARTRRNQHHYGEWVDYFTAAFPPDTTLSREERIRQLIAADYSIHFHVFTFESFRDLIRYSRDVLGFPLDMVDAARPMRGSWESLFILAKCAGDEPTTCAEEPDRHAGETVTRLEARWQEDQIALEHSDLIIEYLRARLAEAEARAEQTVARQDGTLAAKNEYIRSLEARLGMIEQEILPWKDAYIEYLEGHVRARDASKAMRVGRAVRRLLPLGGRYRGESGHG